ncbi:MAG: CTP synthase [Lachnospiraceae bacterium]|nr:CTP synthase [Lachnospiraceae bacterium]
MKENKEHGGTIFEKISLFCNVPVDCVIENRTLPNLYQAPVMLEEAGLSKVVLRGLNLEAGECDLTEWSHMLEKIQNQNGTVTIALVGKYVQLHDAYLSVVEALHHAGAWAGVNVKIKWVDSEKLETQDVAQELKDADGILIPGGFGNRGIEGMISAAEFARANKKPYLGICLGMQIAVIEFARHIGGIRDANSGEFDENCQNKVIDFMPGQSDEINKGGTLRLGSYPCMITAGTRMEECYGAQEIAERHRHRYEFNNDYREVLTEKGLVISGLSPDGQLVETVELADHPYFVGVQFHPEFKSRPNRPHPLFLGLVNAAKQENS